MVCEHGYMNIHPPPPKLLHLATALTIQPDFMGLHYEIDMNGYIMLGKIFLPAALYMSSRW